jgi:hypothetical protein
MARRCEVLVGIALNTRTHRRDRDGFQVLVPARTWGSGPLIRHFISQIRPFSAPHIFHMGVVRAMSMSSVVSAASSFVADHAAEQLANL